MHLTGGVEHLYKGFIMKRLQVTKMKNLNLLILTQEEERSFFVGTPDKIIISIPTLASILKFLLNSNLMSPKVLEGILTEYWTSKE